MRGAAHVAQRDELALRLLGAGDGGVVPAQHRQRHDLGHLRLRGVVGLAEAAESRGGAVEALHGLGHAATRQVGDAGGPVGQRLDLARDARGRRARR